MNLKALVVADHESEYIWDYFDRNAFSGVDVIISCGDLKASYLSFLVTMLHAPVLYVRGNHDARYDRQPPEGCDCLDNRILTVKGVRFLGLGGCKSGSHQPENFTESAMRRRIAKLRLSLFKRRGFDVLVTHAPAKGLGDGDDTFHEGFQCFRDLIDKWQPRYYLHGHQHLQYTANGARTIHYNATTIINGYNYTIVDMTFPDRGGKQA